MLAPVTVVIFISDRMLFTLCHCNRVRTSLCLNRDTKSNPVYAVPESQVSTTNPVRSGATHLNNS